MLILFCFVNCTRSVPFISLSQCSVYFSLRRSSSRVFLSPLAAPRRRLGHWRGLSSDCRPHPAARGRRQRPLARPPLRLMVCAVPCPALPCSALPLPCRLMPCRVVPCRVAACAFAGSRPVAAVATFVCLPTARACEFRREIIELAVCCRYLASAVRACGGGALPCLALLVCRPRPACASGCSVPAGRLGRLRCAV